MGWLRSVGSVKLYVACAEYCLFYRSLLQRRPIIQSILLSEATPRLHTDSTLLYTTKYTLLHTEDTVLHTECTLVYTT